jgi:hypothetical protein
MAKSSLGVLWRIWSLAEQLSGKRVTTLLPTGVPHYESEHGRLEKDLRIRVQAVCAAQIDRLLAPRKTRAGHCGRRSTKPSGLLKTQIPIQTNHWDIIRPGCLRADTVAHSGGNLKGDFVWSLNSTDFHSGSTANRAVWNKGAHGIVEATREVEAALPFELLGFDTDNGSECLHWHLRRHFEERPKAVAFTCSRPFHKNDNSRVEKKKWTRMRQILGNDRMDDPAMLDPIKALYLES